MRCWGQQLDDSLYKQIQVRENLIGLENKTIEQLQYLNSNTAWSILRSGVNVGNENNSELAKKYVLCGGAASAVGSSSFGTRNGIDFNIESELSDKAYGLTSDFGFRPMPGITSVSVSQKDTWGAIREAKINFQVWSLADFQAVDTLYFKPGFIALLEYGHTFWLNEDGKVEPMNVDSLVSNSDFFDKHCTLAYIENIIAGRRKEYRQNYQGFVGYITNFNYTFNDKGGYDCSVTLLSKGSVIKGITIAGTTKSSVNSDKDSENQEDIKTTAYHEVLNAFDSVKKWNNRNSMTLKDIYEKLVSDGKDSYLSRLNLTGTDLEKAKVLKYCTTNSRNSKSTRKNNTYFMSLGTLLEIINRFNLAAYVEAEKGGVGQPDELVVDGTRYITFKSKINFLSGYNDSRYITLKPEESAKFVTFPAHFSLDPLTVVKISTPETGIPVCKEVDNAIKFEKNVITIGKTERRRINGSLPAIDSISLGSDDILNICIDFNAFLAELDNYIETKPSKYYLDEVIRNFLARIQKAFGNINAFEIVPCFNKDGIEYLSIVDTNYVSTVRKNEELKKIHASGLKTMFHELKASSELSPNLVNEVSIAANGAKGCSSDLIKWGEDCYSRHILVGPEEQDSGLESEKPELLLVSGSGEKESSVTYEKNALIEFCKNVSRYYNKLSRGNGKDSEKAISDSEELATANQVTGEDLFKQFVEKSSTGTTNIASDDGIIPACGVLPIKVECSMRGLGGFVVGETFGLYPGTLPNKYDSWGYIITGVSDEISSSGWKTMLKTQYFPAKVNISTTVRQDGLEQSTDFVGPVLKPSSDEALGSYLPPEAYDTEIAKTMTLKQAREQVGPGSKSISRCANYTGRIAALWQTGQDPGSVGGNADSNKYSNFLMSNNYLMLGNTNTCTCTAVELNSIFNKTPYLLERGVVLQYWTENREHFHSCIRCDDYIWYSDFKQVNPCVYLKDGRTYTWYYRIFSPKDKSRYT